MFVNITEDDKGQPFEVFVTLGKAGGSAMADAEAMGRLISLALRSGIPMMEIHRQLRGISSDRAVGLGPNKVLSVPDAIGIALEEWWRDRTLGRAAGAAADDCAAPCRRRRRRSRVGARRSRRRLAEQAQLSFEAYNGGRDVHGHVPGLRIQLEYAEGCVKCHVCGFRSAGDLRAR